MSEPNATAFRLWTRMTKALPDADSGEIVHGGVLSRLGILGGRP